jgi:hypothetical protein
MVLNAAGKDDKSGVLSKSGSFRAGKVGDDLSSSSLKSSGSKSALKKKGRSVDKSDLSGHKIKVGKKKKPRAKKKTLYEKVAQSCGFYVGTVTLHDPRALEAAQALELEQWHLRKLRLKFDRIDIDGSGNIDYEEFFEAVGEERSPFTDKLFNLIGKHTILVFSCLVTT